MAAKNKPIYEFFCKGIMNRKHKGIRFDENGNVVCEPNAEFGADVDVNGALTINSAKDLKTKDGTSFGGSEESIQDIPIVTVTEQSGAITGELKNKIVNRIKDDKILNICRIYFNGIFLGIVDKNSMANFDENNVSFGTIGYFNIGLVASPVVMTISYVKNSNELNYDFRMLQLLTGSKLSLMAYGTGNVSQNSIALTDDWGDTLEKVGLEVTFSKINGMPIVGSDSSADIKVQSTLYRHTVTFSENGLGYTNRFTAYSEKNTPIDSIQDLITVFGNTELMCTGTIEGGSDYCVGINIGTTADTILFLGLAGATQKLSLWYSTGPEVTLTITDNVTAM